MNYLIATIVLITSTYLFKKASGNLKLNMLNISSYAFYSLMIFEFIGVTLVFLGFRNHYLIQRISSDDIINKTYIATAYVMIILPLVIYISNKYIYKIKDINKAFTEKNTEEISMENEEYQDRVFILIIIAMIMCIIAIIYVFKCIGYIPLLKYFNTGFDFAKERINISRNFNGNEYIKNIVMILVTPVLSYISYTYMRITKERRWKILFVMLFVLSIFVKTYDFEKAPIVYYICYFFIIEVMLGKTLNFKKVIPYIISAILLVFFMYSTVANYEGSYISLSNGPLSRTVITQAGTLFLHFDAFPRQRQFLNGHSFPPFTRILFGEGNYDVRSGRIVMEIYNKKAVENRYCRSNEHYVFR